MKSLTITITLPALSTDQAIGVLDALETVIDAIWDVHGDAMADVLASEALGDPNVWIDAAPEPSEDDVPL